MVLERITVSKQITRLPQLCEIKELKSFRALDSTSSPNVTIHFHMERKTALLFCASRRYVDHSCFLF